MPNCGLPRACPGKPNCVRLKRLKNSERNSRPTVSVSFVRLKSAKSKLLIPCARSFGSTRLAVPKVKAAGCEKQEVLNHRLSFDCAEPEICASQPETTFGREPPPKELVRLEAVPKRSGNPLCAV